MANKLILELIADSSQLLKGLNQAQRSLNQFVQAAGGAGSAIGGTLNQSLSVFTNLAKGGGAAAGILAGALVVTASSGVAMALAAGKQAEELEQLSAVTGIGTDKLQDYEVVLNRANLTGQDLVQVMKHMSTSLDQARQGTGTAADRFKQLGIDIRTVTSTDDLIRKIAGSSSKFADGAEKAAIMSDLLGKGWATFIKAFGGGTKAMDDAAMASRSLGAALSGGQLAELAAMDDRVDDLTLAWTRFSQQLGSFVAPAVDFAARALTNLLAMASNALKSLNALGGVDAAADTRATAPAFVDTAKLAERGRAMADAQMKAAEQVVKNDRALDQVRLQNFEAFLSAQKGLDLANDVAIAQQHEAALQAAGRAEVAHLNELLTAHTQFAAKKGASFLADEKSQAEKSKFEVEAGQKTLDLLNQIEVATLASQGKLTGAARQTADLMQQLRLQPLEEEVATLATVDRAQQALFATEHGLLGASDAARRVRFTLIEAEAALTRAKINETIMDETRKAQAIQNLELDTDTKRRQTIQAFPSFFEQQMQAIVASNVFSMGSMVSTWSSGIAQMAVHGGNLVAVWEQTQVAIVQAALNAGVQQAVQWALQASVELGILSATEAAKLGLKTATNAAIVAGDAAAATATVGIWGGASAAILGFFASTLAGFEAIVGAMVATVSAVGTFVMGVLSGIAAALTATVFGIPWAGAILVGVALIAAALAATGNLGFKEGGIGDFGSGTSATLHGPEAIIPLNSRGAAFMREAVGMGGGGGGEQRIIFQIGNDVLVEKVLKGMPRMVRMKLGTVL